MDSEISHVSDTALMTAACRAIETERPDGLVRDPFASRLAGARGMAIARSLPQIEIMCFGVGIRSRFLDELVFDAIGDGKAGTVLNLGAGLDTRPWRLDLPRDLRWIEVDLPAISDYKRSILEGETPKCKLERLTADLTNPEQRAAALRAAGPDPALLITEGLLSYLPAASVEALAAEPVRVGGVRYWLLDIATREVSLRVRMNSFESIQRMRAEDHLDGAQILDAVHRNGWTSLRHRSYTVDALEAARQRIWSLSAGRPPEEAAPPLPDDPSGVHLFGRAGSLS